MAIIDQSTIIPKEPARVPGSSSSRYKRALMMITTVPQSDRILVGGKNGERVSEVSSNVVRVELKEGDEYLLVRKHKYKDVRQEIGPWNHGDRLSRTVYLEQEM